MKITRIESFLTNAGLRNYLFIRLTTDSGLSGIGEASLEWQEKNGSHPHRRMGGGACFGKGSFRH